MKKIYIVVLLFFVVSSSGCFLESIFGSSDSEPRTKEKAYQPSHFVKLEIIENTNSIKYQKKYEVVGETSEVVSLEVLQPVFHYDPLSDYAKSYYLGTQGSVVMLLVRATIARRNSASYVLADSGWTRAPEIVENFEGEPGRGITDYEYMSFYINGIGKTPMEVGVTRMFRSESWLDIYTDPSTQSFDIDPLLTIDIEKEIYEEGDFSDYHSSPECVSTISVSELDIRAKRDLILWASSPSRDYSNAFSSWPEIMLIPMGSGGINACYSEGIPDDLVVSIFQVKLPEPKIAQPNN
ncbi:MAG: hypothetical protein OEZ47_15380 [Gammaproteobacteria bacterium]|nr:hypothetical protein [Gammaproteobacteria bacterium]